jgi:phosphatidylethanolamine/phosphatidyl-N-methylethanolamine N-methyltransferase
MRLRLKDQLARKFDEEVRFFKGWQKDRKGVGASRRAEWQAS